MNSDRLQRVSGFHNIDDRLERRIPIQTYGNVFQTFWKSLVKERLRRGVIGSQCSKTRAPIHAEGVLGRGIDRKSHGLESKSVCAC